VTTTAGSLTITQAVTANGSGTVDLRAGGATSDVNVNGVTVSSTSGAIQVIAGRSILTNTATATTTEFSTSGTLLLDAGDAIGVTGNRIDTDVGTLAARVTGAATTRDALTIGTATGLNGNANLSGVTTANNNDLTVTTTAGSLTITQAVTANG